MVERLNDTAFMGLFLPCRKMPQLKVFENASFDAQLKELLVEKLSTSLFLNEKNFLIKLPFVYQWFYKDLMSEKQLSTDDNI